MDRPHLIAVLVLLLAASVSAQTTGTEAQTSQSGLDMLLSINPLILIVAGIILFLAAGLAKYVAIALVLIGVVSLIISLI